MFDDDRALIDTMKRSTPTVPGIDLLTIAFEAGRRAGCVSARRWRVATVGATVTAMAVASFAIVDRPRGPLSPDDERRASPPAFIAIEPTSPLPPSVRASTVYADMSNESVIVLRDAVLERGLNALPRRPISAVRAVSVLDNRGGAL